MTDKTKNSDQDFLDRFDRASDEVPVDESEAEQLLLEAGIDATAALKRTLAFISEVEARQKRERYAQAEERRKAALARLQPTGLRRTRHELLARIAELKAGAQQPQAYHRNLESVPVEDLESLVAQLEELVTRGKKE